MSILNQDGSVFTIGRRHRFKNKIDTSITLPKSLCGIEVYEELKKEAQEILQAAHDQMDFILAHQCRIPPGTEETDPRSQRPFHVYEEDYRWPDKEVASKRRACYLVAWQVYKMVLEAKLQELASILKLDADLCSLEKSEHAAFKILSRRYSITRDHTSVMLASRPGGGFDKPSILHPAGNPYQLFVKAVVVLPSWGLCCKHALDNEFGRSRHISKKGETPGTYGLEQFNRSDFSEKLEHTWVYYNSYSHLAQAALDAGDILDCSDEDYLAIQKAVGVVSRIYRDKLLEEKRIKDFWRVQERRDEEAKRIKRLKWEKTEHEAREQRKAQEMQKLQEQAQAWQATRKETGQTFVICFVAGIAFWILYKVFV